MNKHLFRVIFNRSRGQLMAVAENVAAHGTSGGQKKPNRPLRSDPHDAWRFQLSPVSLSLWLLGNAMVLVPVPVFSQIIADPSAPRTQQPTILNTANGLPLVNIQTPSAAGVSRNTYRQFDVNAQGAILNNARSNAQTQLGGWVQANPWLAAGSARVILNEVNSSLPSQLRGYIEVAGARAQVVIANPAGISCDGCGFINANRTTLTTGVPVIGNGALEGYRVSQGTIEVSGAGMDTSQSDFTDLIARAARINAGIWAQDLKISTGTAEINEDHQRLNTLSPAGNAPSYAVDVSSLGGMYAGKIALIGTESGLGVRNAGQIAASAGDVSVSQDGWLDNAGKIVSSRGTSIATTGDLQNTGSIHAQASLLLESNQRVTNSGSLISASDIGIHSGQLSNQGGGLIGAENNVSLVAGTVDNQESLVTAGQLLSIKTDHLDNRFTDRPDQSKGLQGRDVSVIAGKIDNQTGQVLANRDLYFESTAQVDNSNGLIGSTGNLSIVDSQPAKSLSVVNGGGTLLAGQLLDIQSDHLDGNGQILSQGDIRLSVSRDLSNQSRIQAAHSLELSSEGKVTNQSQLLAGQTIRVAARDFDNTVNGEVNAARTTLNIQDTLANRGLIDGQETGLSSRVVNNIGTGRIYGDHVAIQAGTLNNDQESGNAGTIAARDRLDIGAGILNNREHALLFSAGDMVLAGHVDGANNQAAGTAQAINNNSARIEALGNLSLAATTINNTNEHLATAVLPVGNTHYIVEYQGSGSANRYLPGTPGVEIYNDESDHLRTPEGTYEQWMQYAYYRNIQETTVIQTDPGVISSGGNIAISATTLLNDNSHILAGGQLDAAVQTLKNQEAPGQRLVTDSGTVTHFWRQGEKGRDSTGSSVASYNPATVITDISLSTIRFEKNTVGTVGMQLQGQQARTLSASATAIAPFLTNSSLFHVSQNPRSGYLIETDPRFAGYREWLSSDYMLDQLRMDPALLHKRLGDGFYEQKLIREQVAELTGKRFLEGFSSDEAQYRTLIDNALTYAGQWDLRPGIALTPAQIAQLTSDIVWLVEKDVTLPDGQVTKALVPQVYVRVQEGDLQGSGALLSAGTMNLDIKGDLFNQGTVAGRDVLAINAGTIQNMGGRMTGQDVLVATRNDFNNVGGTLDASRNLGISAGGDLNVTSTTRSNSNAQSSHTSLNRLAGLYVTGQEGGSLTLVAGHDINLTGAGVGNASSQGQTVLAAGHDLNLNTVTTTEQQSIVWNGDNWRKDSARQEVGTSIQTSGDLRLSAGNDLNARGASVTSDQGMLLATAGNNVNLTAAGNTRNVDEAHRHKESNSAFSSTTITTRDTLAQTTTRGTIFSGDTVAVQAGKDLQLSGSNVVSTAGTTLVAGNDIRIEAATESTAERHFRDEKKSGLFSSGGIGFTIGTQQQSADNQNTATHAAASTVGATSGDVTISAGNNYKQDGSHVVAPQGNIDIAAKKIDILEAQETSHGTYETKFKQSGLTVTVTAPLVSAIQTAQQMKVAAGKTDDERLQVLAGATTALAARNSYDSIAADPMAAGGVSVSITLGGSKSESKQTRDGTHAAGSTVAAGSNVTIRATGAGQDSNLTVQGSDVKAGNDVTLQADGDIRLLAAKNTAEQHSTN
ncbi:hemagglutinin repeat-containing protein, partial [Laribacter hongkongensis]|uniref:two-partner secretion domain-containing protein n=1 Tax=Laribacter hongkongensis TaxID=168471 RepID=UPI001EFC7346